MGFLINMKKRQLTRCVLLCYLLMGSLTGCNGTQAYTADNQPAQMENEDVVILSFLSERFLDVSLQRASLKENTLLKKTIKQVLLNVCRDFDRFSPYQMFTFDGFVPPPIFTLEGFDNRSIALPTYTYFPAVKKIPARLVNNVNGEVYMLDKNWCEDIRQENKK